jgi:hypothetical protein
MADAALLIRWDSPKTGREKEALSLFGSSLEYYGTLQSEGKIESFEPVLLSPGSGNLNGFILLRGSAEKLAALKRDDQFVERMISGQYLIAGFGLVDGYIGGDLQARMAKYAQVVAK